MAEFTPITTQEEFDSAIKERIERERAKYADYDSLKENAGTLQKSLDEANCKVSSMETQISELNGKIKDYEKTFARNKIAKAAGLPEDLYDRIQGDTDEDMKKDAEKLAEIFKKNEKKVAPLKKESADSGDSKKSAYKNMLNEMFSEN